MKYFTKAMLLLMILCIFCSCAPTTPDPNGPTSTEQQDPSATTPDTPVATAQNLLLDENAKQNTGILPRGVTKKHSWIKTAAGNTLTVYYPAEQDAFTYHNGKNIVGETAWLRSLKEEYDITVHAVRKAPSSALSAQRMAILSGLQLDLLAFTPTQLPYAHSLTTDATTMLEKQEDIAFLNTKLLTYGGNSKRYFTPVGIARNLWYVSSEGGNTPLSLSESKLWDLDAFTNFIATSAKIIDGKVAQYGYEVQDYTDFLAALGTPLVTFDKQFADNSAATAENLKKLQQINAVTGRYYHGKTNDENAPSLAKGTLRMRYGQTPFVGNHDKYPVFGFAPLPTANRHESEGIMSACAPILALPKNGAKNEIALNVALLWCARFADANHDLLRFTYGMSFTAWEKYYHATNRLITPICTGDDTTADQLTKLVTATVWDDANYTALCDSVAATVKSYNERLPQ